MNRSFSKKRHITEANKSLERRTQILKEGITGKPSRNNEKEFFVEFLNTQRKIEDGLLFLTEQEEQQQQTQTQDTQTQGEQGDDYELTGEEEVFNEPDYEEFMKFYFQNFMGPDDAPGGTNQPDIFAESFTNKKNNLLLEQTYPPPGAGWRKFKRWVQGLAGDFARNKFFKWIDKRFNGDFKRWWRIFKGDFKRWLKKVGKWDLVINKNRQFEKTLLSARSSKGYIKIGVWRYLNFGKPKEAASVQMDSTEEYNTVTTPENYDTYLTENERVMVKLMNDTSKTKWKELKADPVNKGYAVAVLEYFNSTYREKKWKVVSVGKSKEEFKEEIKKDPKAVVVPPTELVYPSADFMFPVNEESEPNLFLDNASDRASAIKFTQEVKLMCEEIKAVMEGFDPPEGKPKAYLQAYGLESSASRLRNTGIAIDLTFLQLSNARIKTAQEIIFEELTNIGVLVDSETISKIDNTGTNKDGTSGPNPPASIGPNKYYFIPKGNYTMNPPCKDNTTVVKGVKCNRNECGAPHATKAEYDQYKYIRGWFTVIFNDTIIPVPEETTELEGDEDTPEYQVIETVKYPVIMWSPPKKPFRIPLIGLKARWIDVFKIRPRQRKFRGQGTTGPPKGGFKTLGCPKF